MALGSIFRRWFGRGDLVGFQPSPAAMADAKAAGETMSVRANGFVSGYLETHCGAPAIDPRLFDYSLESLKAVDEFLARVRDRAAADVLAGEIRNLSVFAIHNGPVFLSFVGAYSGEVIRTINQGRLVWRSFDSLANDRNFAGHLTPGPNGHDVAGEYVLAGAREIFTCLPLQKVVKFMMNGQEDSLYAYALAVGRTRWRHR